MRRKAAAPRRGVRKGCVAGDVRPFVDDLHVMAGLGQFPRMGGAGETRADD
jgi:hypothetical protein